MGGELLQTWLPRSPQFGRRDDADRSSIGIDSTPVRRTLLGIRSLAAGTVAALSTGQIAILVTMLTAFTVMTVDAVRNPYSAIDLPIMNAVQPVHHEWFREITWSFAVVTGSSGAVIAWMVAMVGLVLVRWWSCVAVMLLVPFGGVINFLTEHGLVARTRPHLPELIRGSTSWDEGSYPSGHVLGRCCCMDCC